MKINMVNRMEDTNHKIISLDSENTFDKFKPFHLTGYRRKLPPIIKAIYVNLQLTSSSVVKNRGPSL